MSQEKVFPAVAGTSRRCWPWEDRKELELKPKLLCGRQAEANLWGDTVRSSMKIELIRSFLHPPVFRSPSGSLYENSEMAERKKWTC